MVQINESNLAPSSGKTAPLTDRLLYVNGKLILLAVHRHIKVYTKCYKYACYLRFTDRVSQKHFLLCWP